MIQLKTVGLTLILGTLLFLSASFLPTVQVYMEPSPEARLAIIQEYSEVWLAAQALPFSGALVTALGIALAAFALPQRRSLLLPLAALAFFAGTIAFLAYLYPRWANPEGWVYGSFPNPMFLTYTFLTQAGLLLLGLAFLQTQMPRWIGFLTAGSAVLLFILTLVFGDMFPDIYYLITLPAGIWLLRRKASPAGEALTTA
jgi:hypothetical protein